MPDSRCFLFIFIFSESVDLIYSQSESFNWSSDSDDSVHSQLSATNWKERLLEKYFSLSQGNILIYCMSHGHCWEGYFGNVRGYRLQVTLFKI